MADKRGPVSSENFPLTHILTGKNYILGIGIDRYKDWPPLSNPVNDVKQFVKILNEQYQFKDDPDYQTTLFDEKATRQNIFDTLRKYIREIRAGDSLIIYFAGHGFFDKELEHGYWVPYESEKKREKTSNYISNDEIIRFINQIKSKHTFLIADSCFSGSLFTKNRSEGIGLEKLLSFQSRWALTSGRIGPVGEGQPGEHSPFAKTLLEFLSNNREKKIWVSNLAQHVISTVPRNSNQIPQGEPLKGVGDLGGQFLFRRMSKTEKEDWHNCIQEDSIPSYHNFLKKHPNTSYFEEITDLLSTSSAFNNALENDPTGKYLDLAKERITVLQKPDQRKKQKKILIFFFSIFILFTLGVFFTYLIDQDDANTPKKSAESIIIDGHVYLYAEIDSLWWQTTNLYFFPTDTANENYWKENGQAFYQWTAAKEACKALGDSSHWRLPTKLEWQSLINKYSGPKQALDSLKREGNSGLNLEHSGFWKEDQNVKRDTAGFYWTSSEYERDSHMAWSIQFGNFHTNKIDAIAVSKTLGFSCRCVRVKPKN